jgi:DNA-binding transcriptional ArsR family regulator
MRWPAALATALACIAWIGLPAAAADAADPPGPQPVAWHALDVPWPNVGDAGSYSRSIVRMSGSDAHQFRVVEDATLRESFLVEPASDSYDQHGEPHQVVSFRTWLPADARDVRYRLDAQDGATVAVTFLERSNDGFRNWTYLGGIGKEPPLCGLRNALQGAADPGDAVLVLQGGLCRHADSSSEGGVGFLRVREDPWGDGVAVGFQQIGTDKVVLSWFTSGIPYPVRMLEEVGDGTYAILDLTNFQRGAVPAAQGPSTLSPLPPLQLSEHLGVGSDESGIEHPFPWHEAWAAAQQDPAVAEFLADHPTAVVQRTVYNFGERHRPSGIRGEQQEDVQVDAWFFQLDDGQQAAKFVVRHVVGQRSIPVPVVGPVTTEPIDEVEVEDLGSQPADPYALLAPPKLPTVASTLTWWEAFATKRFHDEGPNGWLTFLSCGCGEPWAVVGVGRLAGSTTVGETTTYSWEASYLLTNWKGEAYALAENVYESDYGRASLPVRLLGKSIGTTIDVIVREARDRLPDLQKLDAREGGVLDLGLGPGAGEETGLPSGTRLSSKAAAPHPKDKASTAVIVGVTAAGAAGLAGLAWLAKVLLAPLFSRVRRESALDHPLRAALMDLVEAEPGLHLQEIMRRTGKGAGAVRHHLAKLQDVGLVKSRLGGGFLCFFPAEAGAAAMAAAGVTKSDGARRVLEAARAGGTAAELARRTGLAPGTVDHHLARLASAGIVRREGTRWLA